MVQNKESSKRQQQDYSDEEQTLYKCFQAHRSQANCLQHQGGNQKTKEGQKCPIHHKTIT